MWSGAARNGAAVVVDANRAAFAPSSRLRGVDGLCRLDGLRRPCGPPHAHLLSRAASWAGRLSERRARSNPDSSVRPTASLHQGQTGTDWDKLVHIVLLLVAPVEKRLATKRKRAVIVDMTMTALLGGCGGVEDAVIVSGTR